MRPRRPARVLHIVSATDELGPGRQIQLLAHNVPGNEFETHVLAVHPSPRAGGNMVVPGARVWNWTVWRLPGELTCRMVGFLRRLRPAIVHVWSEQLQVESCLAAQTAGVPAVSWRPLQSPPPRMAAQLMQRGCERIARCVVVDCEAARQQRLGAGLPAGKLRLIRPGIPRGNGSELPPEDRADLLRALNLAADSRLLAVAAPFDRTQRLKDAIWAADLLKIVRSDCHLFVIGDGPLAWRLRRFRDQVQIADRVHFAAGSTEFFRLLPHLDGLWCTAESGGVNPSVLEAMAHGVPLIATDTAAHRTLIDDGENGLLFPVGHRAGLARCTLKLLNDRTGAARLADTAQARLAAAFPVEAAVSAHLTMYREIAA